MNNESQIIYDVKLLDVLHADSRTTLTTITFIKD